MPVVEFGADAVEERFCRHDLDRHVGQHEFDRLEIADRLAELDAAGGVVIGDLGRADGGPQSNAPRSRRASP